MTPKKIAALMKAVANGSKDPKIRTEYDRVVRSHVPTWHTPMVRDLARNKFYSDMIQKHAKGKVILEIGAGTGLQSLVAAAAGAKHVYACEMNPFFATIAQQNIDASAYADKITLIAKPSTKLKLPEKVDIVVSEIISTDVFSEHLIPTLRDAKRFLKPGGKFLPERIDAYVCLATTTTQPDPDEGLFSNAITQHTDRLVKFTGADNFQMISKPKLLTEVTAGSKILSKAPWTCRLKRTQESYSTFASVYFVAHDGRNKLSNIPKLKGTSFAPSWGVVLYPLSELGETYDLDIHLMDEKIPMVIQR